MNGSQRNAARNRWGIGGRPARPVNLSGLFHSHRGMHYWWLWSFVGLVSIYDTWLIFACRDVIWSTEKNPVGLLLIELNSGGLTLFITTKLICTALVLTALVHIHRFMHRHRDFIITGVASFQAWLLWYLSFSTS